MKRNKPDITLDIVDITPAGTDKHPPMKFPVLPQHEFSMMIIAPKGSGKTNLICNLLTNHLKGYFHGVDICSTTVEGDPKWSVVKKTKHLLAENKKLKKFRSKLKGTEMAKLPKVVHGSGKQENSTGEKPFDGIIPESSFFGQIEEVIPRMDKSMEEILKLKKQLGKKNEEKAKFLADRKLVIIDDKAGCFGAGKTNPLAHKVMLHRHHNYSMIIVTQQYKSIPNQIRTNTNAKILFDIPNENEKAAIYQENPACLKEDAWYAWYDHCMKGQFNFMYINDKFPKNQQVFCNFNKQCHVPEDDEDDDEYPTSEEEPLSSPNKKKTKKK